MDEWNSLIITISCSNDEDFVSFVDIDLYGLALEPQVVQEEMEDEEDVDTYRFNNISMRYQYPFVIRRFSVADYENGGQDWNHADYERMTSYFRARFIRIKSVAEPAGLSRRAMRPINDTNPESGYAYWTTDPSKTRLPRDVRVLLESPESSRDNGGYFGVPVTFEDVRSTIGVVI